MALVACEECGKQVSDKAAVCPQCGAPTVAAPLPAHSAGNKDDGIQEVVVRDRVSYEVEKGVGGLVAFLLDYLPHLTIAVFGFLTVKQLGIGMGLGDTIDNLPIWVVLLASVPLVLVLVFRRRLQTWVGWVPALLLLGWWFFLAPSGLLSNKSFDRGVELTEYIGRCDQTDQLVERGISNPTEEQRAEAVARCSTLREEFTGLFAAASTEMKRDICYRVTATGKRAMSQQVDSACSQAGY